MDAETPHPEDLFGYPRLIARALRGVAREVLGRVAGEGLPGEHHLYLSFRPDAEGVRVPGFLADRYPDEVTVILQNQFWDLEVDDDAFSVTLTFGGARQRLTVPFAALTAFADPAVGLGLRFEPPVAEEGADEMAGEAEADAGGDRAEIRRKSGGETESAEGGEGEGGEVVSIDRFRRD